MCVVVISRVQWKLKDQFDAEPCQESCLVIGKPLPVPKLANLEPSLLYLDDKKV